MQSLWWLVRQVRWIRYPIIIPISVVFIALVGVAPSDITGLFISATVPIARYVWGVFSGLSVSWLKDHWLWFLPVICCAIWFCRHCGAHMVLDAADNPVESRRAALSPEPPKPAVASPAEMPLPTMRDASRIWCHGDALRPLISDSCPEEALYHIPLSAGMDSTPSSRLWFLRFLLCAPCASNTQRFISNMCGNACAGPLCVSA